MFNIYEYFKSVKEIRSWDITLYIIVNNVIANEINKF